MQQLSRSLVGIHHSREVKLKRLGGMLSVGGMRPGARYFLTPLNPALFRLYIVIILTIYVILAGEIAITELIN